MCAHAGLSHTPRSDKTEMFFSPKDIDTYLTYTRTLRDFMAKYDEENQRDQMMFEDCGGRSGLSGLPSPVAGGGLLSLQGRAMGRRLP